jgi:hypothetical protein
MSLFRKAILSAIICALATSQPAAAGTASFTANPASVAAGGSVTVTLSDTLPPLVNGQGVAAIDLTVSFDPTEVSITGVGLGSLLSGWGPIFFNSPSSGVESISIAECGSCSDAAGGPDSVLTLTIFALAGDPTGTTSISAQTTIADVPVPGEYQLAATSDTIGITAASSVPAPGLSVLILPVLALFRARGRRA